MSRLQKYSSLVNIKILLFLAILLIQDRGVAQFHDLNWIIGRGEPYKNPTPGGSGEGLMRFEFKQGLKIHLDTSIKNICYTSFTCACISDEAGKLVAYTDGHNIFDDKHKIMQGGDTINPGNFWQGFLGFGYPISDGAIFLPIPYRKGEYILLHKRVEFGKVEGRLPEYKCDKLYVSTFAYDSVQTRYIASEKNRILLDGEIAENEFAVCKHGNGKDYWVVARKIGEPLYYFFLIDSQGVYLHHEQQIGSAYFRGDLNGNMIFNREENMMARVIPQEGVEMMEFDRCRGIFSKPSIQSFPDTFLINGNCAFSPSGKYLYVNSILNIYQYEVKRRNERNYKPVHVGAWDSVLIENSYSTLFFVGRLALDDKIYFTVFGTNGYYFHTLHKPEEYGKACDLRNHDFRLPNYMDGGLPFFPNFRNGVLQGSACDSPTEVLPKTAEHLLYSSFWRNRLHISSTDLEKEYNLRIMLSNIEGKIVYDKKIVLRQNIELKIDHLSQGLYVLHILEQEKVIKIDKVVIIQ